MTKSQPNHALPRVSVLLPVRDSSRFIGSAITSLLRQTLRMIEIVVVDDGSLDNTVECVAEMAARDPRIRLVRQDRLGIVAALMMAERAARCELLARLDADDEAYPERLQRQLEFLDQHQDVVLVGSAIDLIDEAGASHGAVSFPCEDSAIRQRLLKANCFAHSAIMMRRSAFSAVGGYREVFSRAQDYDLWLRLSEIGQLANLEEPLLRYRVHANQVSGEDIEQQAIAAIGARAAAGLRSRGLSDDGLLASALSIERLAAYEVSSNLVAKEVLEKALHQAWLLREVGGSIAAATELLSRVLSRTVIVGANPSHRVRLRIALAALFWRGGARSRAFKEALRTILTHPVLSCRQFLGHW